MMTRIANAYHSQRKRSPATLPGYHAGRVPASRGQTLPAEVLTKEEVQLLLKACSPKAATGIRNRALLTLLHRSGLRIGEALALEARDVDPYAPSLRVRHGKGDKARTVGLDAGALSLLQRWLDMRKERGIRTPQIFCTLDGRPLDSSYVRHLLPRLARKAGLDRRVHPHMLRHSCAFEMATQGMLPHEIQQQLGHASLATTSVYLSHLAPAQLLERMKGLSWEA